MYISGKSLLKITNSSEPRMHPAVDCANVKSDIEGIYFVISYIYLFTKTST